VSDNLLVRFQRGMPSCADFANKSKSPNGLHERPKGPWPKDAIVIKMRRTLVRLRQIVRKQ
jgi:hypothetical protein